MKINVKGKTDVGRIRDHNEDSFIALGGEDHTHADALLVVADGMGGHAAGEVASSMTTEHIKSKFRNAARYPDSKNLSQSLKNVLEEVNQAVWDASQGNEKKGMGTTCTLAAIRKRTLFYAHVGDSRAYVLTGDRLRQITRDHSWVADAVEQGAITAEEARVHPNRSVITRAIGLDPSVSVDVGTVKLFDGDLVLLCSDGLNSMVSDAEIEKVLLTSKSRQVCEKLIQAANDAGGHDNTTVVIAVIGDHSKGLDQDTQPLQDTQKVRKSSGFWRKMRRILLLGR